MPKILQRTMLKERNNKNSMKKKKVVPKKKGLDDNIPDDNIFNENTNNTCHTPYIQKILLSSCWV